MGGIIDSLTGSFTSSGSDNTSYSSFKAGKNGENWVNFVFVSADLADQALWTAKETFEFEPGGSNWATSMGDIARCVAAVCNKNSAKVAWLRIVSHGNPDGFLVGNGFVSLKSRRMGTDGGWEPIVKKMAKHFVPGVSHVDITACKTGQNPDLLSAISRCLGGVDVRAYKESQQASAGMADNGRGEFVTCRMKMCSTTAN